LLIPFLEAGLKTGGYVFEAGLRTGGYVFEAGL
jgi:hypothetical protein